MEEMLIHVLRLALPVHQQERNSCTSAFCNCLISVHPNFLGSLRFQPIKVATVTSEGWTSTLIWTSCVFQLHQRQLALCIHQLPTPSGHQEVASAQFSNSWPSCL